MLNQATRSSFIVRRTDGPGPQANKRGRVMHGLPAHRTHSSSLFVLSLCLVQLRPWEWGFWSRRQDVEAIRNARVVLLCAVHPPVHRRCTTTTTSYRSMPLHATVRHRTLLSVCRRHIPHHHGNTTATSSPPPRHLHRARLFVQVHGSVKEVLTVVRVGGPRVHFT